MGKKIIPKKSEYIELKSSKIHNKGVFAKADIPKETELIQYGGELITKKEAEKRIEKNYDRAEKDKKKGENYVLNLNKKYDIDGDFPWNIAKYINHSCNANTELVDIDGEIWFVTTRKIKKGEEITTDYGFDLEDFKNFPCKCGSKNCIGYIIGKDYKKKLKKILKNN